MTRRYLFFALTAGLAIGMAGTESRAATLRLEDLINGGSLTEGGLTFSNFGYGETGNAPSLPASLINVTTISTSTGEAGLEFQGGFIAPGGTGADYLITYTVTPASGVLINDAFLNGDPFRAPGGAANITDTVENPQYNTIKVFGINPDVPTADVTFAPQPIIYVTKDINLLGSPTSLQASAVSTIDQGYSVVPEPTSMALLGIGLSGLFTFRRFLKRALVA